VSAGAFDPVSTTVAAANLWSTLHGKQLTMLTLVLYTRWCLLR